MGGFGLVGRLLYTVGPAESVDVLATRGTSTTLDATVSTLFSCTFAVTTGAFTSVFSLECEPVVHPGSLRNSSNVMTGLLIVLQQE